MLYVVAFFIPPLACLMAGRFLESLFNVFVWILAWVAVLFLPPIGFVFWLVAFLHAGFLVSDKAKKERREELNMILAAQGQPLLPPPARTGAVPAWFSIGAICTVVILIVGGGIASQRLVAERAAQASAPAATTTLTVPPSLALPDPEPKVEAVPATPELPAITSLTYAEVVSRHGDPEAKDSTTGWAIWPAFKARFAGGKVEEIAAR